MSIDLTKRASGGFNLVIDGGPTLMFDSLGYEHDGICIRLITISGKYQTPQNRSSTEWTIGGFGGYTTDLLLANQLDSIGVTLKSSGGSGGGGDASAANQQAIIDIITPKDFVFASQIVTNDGTTDFTNVVSIQFEMRGSGGTINNIPYPDGTVKSFTAPFNSFFGVGIPYTVPTSGAGEIIIDYTTTLQLAL